jgi:hypothetical protein
LQIARQGTTSHPLLTRVFLAQKINRVCATTIGPWEVDELPDTFIDAIKALDTDLAEMRKGFDEVTAAQARIRARYKTP